MKSFQVTDFNAPLKEVDAPTPQPSGTQVLIKVKAAGVCHSDLHIWEGGYDLGHGRKPLSLKDRGVSLPRTMGHETVGEILAFGPDAKAEAGRLVFAKTCAGCHLGQGTLAGRAPQLSVSQNAINADFVRNRVRKGKAPMPAFDTTKVSDADLENIIVYLQAIHKS